MTQPQQAEMQITDALTQDELDELAKHLGDWATKFCAWKDHSYGATRRLHEEYCTWADQNAKPLICDLATFESLLTAQGFDVQGGFVHGMLLLADATAVAPRPRRATGIVRVPPGPTQWLAALLGDGPKSIGDCLKAARRIGYGYASTISAAEYLRVDKVSVCGEFHWKLDPHYQHLTATL